MDLRRRPGGPRHRRRLGPGDRQGARPARRLPARPVARRTTPGMTMIGAGMLWVGWYGFNGGSALAADGDAPAWPRWSPTCRPPRPAWSGRCWSGRSSAAPAWSAWSPAWWPASPPSRRPRASSARSAALILGACGSVVCFLAVDLVKHRLKIDDSLDVFAVHGVGGILGTLLVAVLAIARARRRRLRATGARWAARR